ncbi:MAG TPA: PQQ-dependent sugar dehydrogenase [Casimicrobiaceae bacterium]|nr:PQQ-dependent sugar dehydrogenase [Casimicrobiaceae bacterium]
MMITGFHALRYVLATICLTGALTQTSFGQTVFDSNLQVREVAAGLAAPTAMAFIGTNDILVLQKNDGRVRRVLNGVLQAGQVLDVAVDNASERGLLGIALHPNFPATPSVYLYYTQSSTASDTSGSPAPTGNHVYRYTWTGSSLVNPTLVIALPVTPGPNHDGGTITFGPDGKLYVVIGDLNRNGRLQNYPSGPAPDDTSVVLRLNDDGTIPPDNPFSAQGGNLAKYYAYGIRNSFGLAFDPVTGRLWATENGPSNYDEINLVEPGFNSGWEQIMGPDARDPQGVGDLFQVPGSQYGDPKFSWLSPVGVTAIAFLNSTRLGSQYQNDVFVGDINNGTLYWFTPNAARNGFVFADPGLTVDLVADSASELTEVVFGTGFGGITDLKVGPDGDLYVLSFFTGTIFAISGSVASLTVAPTSVAPGDTVTASWSGIASPTARDWIGLYAPGSANSAFITWLYVSCTQSPASPRASGSCPFVIPSTLPPGNYELRLLANNGFTSLATSETINVGSGGGTTLAVSPTSVAPGGTVSASWNGLATPSASDWIGLYAPGSANSAFITWVYVSCTQSPGSPRPSGSCPFVIPSTLPAGNYELRLLANNGFTSLSTSETISVGSDVGTTLTVGPTSVARGGTVTASWNGIATPSARDWIGLYAPATGNTSFVAWVYVSCTQSPAGPRPSGSCPFTIPSTVAPGNYELRLLADDGFASLATSGTIAVTP